MLTICEVPGCPGGFLFAGTPPPQGHRCWRGEERRGGGEGEEEVRATGEEGREG